MRIIYVYICVFVCIYIHIFHIYIYLYIDKYIWGENSRVKNPRLENFAGFSPEAPQLPQRERERERERELVPTFLLALKPRSFQRERERESSCQHFF